jgi:hypothetical protein
MIEEALELRIF